MKKNTALIVGLVVILGAVAYVIVTQYAAQKKASITDQILGSAGGLISAIKDKWS